MWSATGGAVRDDPLKACMRFDSLRRMDGKFHPIVMRKNSINE
ncbi:hypothetical protein C7S13_4632 [Burkholderia cepacia]|nr:hypothetical protein [Burkholderia cepacia]MDW9250352.1 hypothetical protein [Burkholderia cepacia]